MKQFFTKTHYVLHEMMCALVFSTILYTSGIMFFAIIGTAVAGLIKEILDHFGLFRVDGEWDNNDLVADGLGIALGVIFYILGQIIKYLFVILHIKI
jgi:hypothetical protein